MNRSFGILLIALSFTFSLSGRSYAQCEIEVLTPTAPVVNNFYGWTCRLNGDRAVVGSIGAADACPMTTNCLSGAAYIYEQTQTGWILGARVTASDAGQNRQFGNSGAIEGDVALIGSHLNDKGAAYVFQKQGGAWVETQKLEGSMTSPGFHFGHSLDMSGPTAVIGAMRDNQAGSDSGSAYVFEETMTGWQETAYLTASDGGIDNRFGRSSYIDGDTIIVGAHMHNHVGAGSGAAYVFERDDNGTPGDRLDDTWPEVIELIPSDAAAGDLFGRSVIVEGDWALVGASRSPAGGVDRGAVYVFERVGGVWAEVQKLTAEDGEDDDHFGITVALNGDRALIGASGEDEGASDAGAVYFFERTPNGFAQVKKLLASNPGPVDLFGDEVSVSISGDLAIASAPGNDMGTDNAGIAFIYDLSDCVGTSYCTGNPNSAGAGASISAAGSAVVANNDFTLQIEGCPPQRPGLFYYGPNQIDFPFGEGRRCVGGMTQRLGPPLFTNDDGELDRPVDLALPPAVGSIVAGIDLNFQFWYRDVAGGGTGFNLSDAVNVAWR